MNASSLLQPGALLSGANRRAPNHRPVPARPRHTGASPARGQLSLEDQPRSEHVGLSFRARGGPLLAVVGVCGGAGATTLAYLIAAASALESNAPILLADLGGPGAGIAAYANITSQSFTALAAHLALGQRPAGAPVASGEFGMRVIAAAPELDEPVPADTVTALISQAVAAHALTVLDCGQLTREVERVALNLATHIAWVAPATSVGLRRARMLLQTLRTCAPGREIVVARNDPHAHQREKPPVHELAELADERFAPLVLVPRLDDLADTATEHVLEQAALPLQAFAGLLRR
jgi:MinD-like ATPase involved in chromosome partitioning or flagellar assembly